MAALECYLQALEIDKNHLPSIFNLACNYEQLDQPEKARQHFLHAVKVDPDWP